jgi:hypothetical protein
MFKKQEEKLNDCVNVTHEIKNIGRGDKLILI